MRKLPKKAKTINDVLRYTFILPIPTFGDDMRKIIDKLRESGYQIPEHKIWNAWETIGDEQDRGYRGVNITVISSQNQKFELQFHTEESYRFKTETHFLYKELRNRKTSKEREIELIGILREVVKDLERPNGV